MEVFSTLNRSLYSLGDTLRKDSCISYCTRKSKIPIEHKNNFMNILYRLSQRENEVNWTEEEQILLQASSDFISNYVKILIKNIHKSLNAFQYVLIVPSNCTRQLKDNLIRPIFIRSNLISIQDHRDRLLFFSDLECIFYNLQDPNYQHHVFSKYVVLCKITPIKQSSAASIQLDLVQTNKSLFTTHPNSKQVPNIVRSKSISITSENIKTCLKSCVKEKLYPGDTDAGQYDFMELAIEYIYNRAQCQKKETDDGYSRYDDTDKIYDASTRTWIRHGLKKSQKTKLVRSIRIIDICQKISENLYQSMKDILSNLKECQFLVLEDQYSSDLDLDPSLLDWLKLIIEQTRQSLSNVATLKKINIQTTKDLINRKNIIAGASSGALEFIQNSDIYNKPRILSIKDNLSVFLNSKLNAIINIDISIKSTILSYALINEVGFTEKIFDNTYFTAEMSLPSLGSFYDFSKNKTTLNINEQFISFTKQYLKNDMSHFPMDEENKEFLYNMESILNNNSKETTTSTQKQEYIRFFLFMYMIYIKKILSRIRLPSNSIPDKIGYVISIEKIVQDNVIGTKSDFQELIFATGLLEKDDNLKKLRVITYGEGLLPMIQKYHSYEFPVKSYFLLAQLHEEYVQLTLNQVVAGTEEVLENEESIIVQEEIIPIQNIYDTLCLDMWDHAISNNKSSNLIRFCDRHNNKIPELFLMENKSDFITNLRGYLADNIFKDDSKGQLIGKHTISIISSCNCILYLTMNDIIDISLKPALQEIARSVSSSLINKRLFGNYKNTLHLSILIYFNSNILLHPIISNILKNTIDTLHRAHKLGTSCSIIPTTSPTQIYQPIINQPSFFYSLFQTGTFQQVFSSSYIILINIEKNTGATPRKGPEKSARATTRPRSMTFSNPPNLTDIKRLRESTQITTSILEQDDIKQKVLSTTSTEHLVPQWEVDALTIPNLTSSHQNDEIVCSSLIEKGVNQKVNTTTLIERLASSKPKQNHIENMISADTKNSVHSTQEDLTRESLLAHHKTIATAFLKQEVSNKKKNVRIDNIGSLLLIQGEELKNNSKVVNVRRLQKNVRERVSIAIIKLKTSTDIGSIDNIACKFSTELVSLPESFDYHRGGLPLLISVKHIAYSSTLEFWVSVDGTEYNEKLFEVLEPLALVRV